MGRGRVTLADIAPKCRPQLEALLAAQPRRSIGDLVSGVVAKMPIEIAAQTLPGERRLKQRSRKISILEQRWGMELKAKYPNARIYPQFPFAIATGSNYYCDYVIVEVGEKEGWVRVSAHEVKGPHSREAGIVKVKVAARTYPFVKFSFVSEIKHRGWVMEDVRS